MPRVPSYRLHKPSGQGVVTLSGRDFYLGKYDSPESKTEYARLLQEWIACRQTAPPAKGSASDITVVELVEGYLRHADSYYRKGGQVTSEVASIKRALGPVVRLYGFELAKEFGPNALRATRQALIESGYCRGSVNKHVGRIVRAFKWGAEHELLPASVWQTLKSLPGLRRGRTEAPEGKPVRPVPDAHVDSVRPFVTPAIWALIELMRLTGARVGEVVAMRGGDLDRSGEVWCFRPSGHKTEHLDKQRTLYLGPRAQAVLKPWLRADPDQFLFSPKQAMAEFRERQHAARKSPVQPSQRNRRTAKPRKVPGDHYTVGAVEQAIAKACRKAGVPHWHPHQLRHNAATFLRREYGLEVARVILGHATASITEVYAEVDRDKAIAVMAKVG
jgi:integrase